MPEIVSVSLIVEADHFFERSQYGTIRGTVYFRIGEDTYFPERGWTDLVAAFVRAWLDELQRLAKGIKAKERVPFFDGPLAVELSVLTGGLVELKFTHKDEVKATLTAVILQLLHDAQSAAQNLLSMCRRNSWSNDDTERLSMLTESGRQIH